MFNDVLSKISKIYPLSKGGSDFFDFLHNNQWRPQRRRMNMSQNRKSCRTIAFFSRAAELRNCLENRVKWLKINFPLKFSNGNPKLFSKIQPSTKFSPKLAKIVAVILRFF